MEIMKNFLRKIEKHKKTIYVVGDPMLDEYFNVKVSRISPEFPTQVMLSSNYKPSKSKPGGAANVCFQLTNFNADVTLFGPLDPKSKVIFEKNYNFNCKTYPMLDGRIPRKKRFYDGDYALPRWDVEKENYGHKLPNELRKSVFKIFEKSIEAKKPDVVIFSDYGKGVFDEKIAQKYVKLCKKKKIFTIVDPKNILEAWSDCDIFKPNEKEVKNLSFDNHVLGAGIDIVNKLNCKAVIVTRGGQPPMIVERTESKPVVSWADEELEIKRPQSVIGAGDCFVSFLAMAITHGYSYEEATSIAYKAGSLYVENKYNRPLYPHELTESKFLSGENLAKLLKDDYFKNKKVAITNGCYDIIHPGHIHLLKEAKKRADILIVALNSDDSVKRLKGMDRPCNNLEDRISVISGLGCVDLVTFFDEDTPKKLFEKIGKFDILVKGGDYSADNIVGKEHAKETVILPFLNGKSTTNIIRRLE